MLQSRLLLGSTIDIYDQHRDLRLDVDNMSYEVPLPFSLLSSFAFLSPLFHHSYLQFLLFFLSSFLLLYVCPLSYLPSSLSSFLSPPITPLFFILFSLLLSLFLRENVCPFLYPLSLSSFAFIDSLQRPPGIAGARRQNWPRQHRP